MNSILKVHNSNYDQLHCVSMIRNESSYCITVVELPMEFQTNHLAKAMDSYQTLVLVKSMGFTKVWLEGDPNNIVQCLKGLSSPSWTIKNIISQAKEIINSLELCIVSHNYRETNTIVDWVANMAIYADHTMR